MDDNQFYVLVSCRERHVSNKVLDIINGFNYREYVFDVSDSLKEGLRLARKSSYNLIVFEFDPVQENAAGQLREIREIAARTPLILLTGENGEGLEKRMEDTSVLDCLEIDSLDKPECRKAFQHVVKMHKCMQRFQTDSLSLNCIMDNAPVGIFLKDLNGAYIKVNRIMAGMLGIRHMDEAIGKSDACFYPPEYCQKSLRDEGEIIRTGQPVINSEGSRVAMGDGQIMWISTTKIPLYDSRKRMIGIAGFERDITGFKIMENELEIEKKHILHAVIDNIPDLVYVKDTESRFILSNKATRTVIGANSPVEALGKTDFEFFPRELAEKYYNDEQAVINSRQPKISVIEKVVNSEGDNRWLSTTKVPFYDPSGKIMGIIGIGRDITEMKQLTEKLNESVDSLNNLFIETVKSMSALLETRDPYTAGHQRRVAELACAIAREMQLPEEVIRGIYFASILHDIGKICVPAEILTKPGKLSDAEFNLIKEHSMVGYNILKSINFPWPIAKIVLQHHVRIDGSGYPGSIQPSDLLLESKIIMVSDVIEAISSHRPYRPALGLEKALEEITGKKGIFYDPDIVDACISLFKDKNFELNA